MILHDVNVLVYSYRQDIERHDDYRASFDEVVVSPSAFGYSSLALAGFVRVVTHPKMFAVPSLLEDALDFVEAVKGQPNAVEIRPGSRHWQIFIGLCESSQARGNLVSDAYHAALAIESGSELITTDRDFARFPGLRWRHPLENH